MEGSVIDSRQKLEQLVRIAYDKKADGLTVLDVHALTSYADYFIIASAASNRQVKAIANALVEDAKHSGFDLLGVEGLDSAKWVLIDLGDIVAHLFFGPVRPFYDLEGLWTDAPRVDLEALLGEPLLPHAPAAAHLDDDEDDFDDADIDEDDVGEDDFGDDDVDEDDFGDDELEDH